MLQASYDELDPVSKLSIQATSQSSVLMDLIETEIKFVEESLCNLEIGAQLVIMYAVGQQRLICLRDLRDFFNRVREESMPQPETE